MSKSYEERLSDAEAVEAYLAKKGKAVKVDAFGIDRGFVKGHGGKEGGSYKRASIRRNF